MSLPVETLQYPATRSFAAAVAAVSITVVFVVSGITADMGFGEDMSARRDEVLACDLFCVLAAFRSRSLADNTGRTFTVFSIPIFLLSGRCKAAFFTVGSTPRRTWILPLCWLDSKL